MDLKTVILAVIVGVIVNRILNAAINLSNAWATSAYRGLKLRWRLEALRVTPQQRQDHLAQIAAWGEGNGMPLFTTYRCREQCPVCIELGCSLRPPLLDENGFVKKPQ